MVWPKKLTAGDPAPALQERSALGEPVSLDALRGKPVWVAFFRYTSCSFCGLRIHQMIARAERWQQRGLQILGVFQSPEAAVAPFVRERQAPFPFVCDPEERLYAEWGLETSVLGLLRPRLVPTMTRDVVSGRVFKQHGSLTRIPADFLIDEQGRVAVAFYGRDIGEHIPLERVEEFLDERGSRKSDAP
jgi:peroxiredoxin